MRSASNTRNASRRPLLRRAHIADLPYSYKAKLTQWSTYCGREISCTIEILGHQTLHDLHTAIFKAFERQEEHFNAFHLGEAPSDRSKLHLFRGGWDGQSGPPPT